jgi:hypothetical protein
VSVNRPGPSLLGAAGLLAVLASLAASGGCGTSKPALDVQRYTIEVPDGPLPAAVPGARLVALSPVRINPLFVGASLVYRVGGDRVEVDHYASLAAAPRSLMTAAIRAYLLREPGILGVVSGLAGSRGLTIEANLQEMSGDFTRAKEPAGVLSLEVSVYPGDPVPGTLPVFRKVYTRREPLPKRTAEEVVAAWNRALPSIMHELGKDLAAPLAAP